MSEVTTNIELWDGKLTYSHPEGKKAVSLGLGDQLVLNIIEGPATTIVFKSLSVSYSGETTKFNDMNLAISSVEAKFPNGPTFELSRGEFAGMLVIKNNGPLPASGEWDAEFSVTATDGGQDYTLDPEIRVRSGTSGSSATWIEHSTS